MSSTKRVSLCVSFALLALASGCTHLTMPRKYPIDAPGVAAFANAPSVNVVNAGAAGMVLVGTQGFHKWLGDMNQWTSVAASLLEDELAKRGVTTKSDAKKTVKLSITRSNLFWGFAAIRCILNLHAEFGDGRTFDFEGNNASPATLDRAVDGAVTRATQALLESSALRSYLESQ
jgi:hypothetical protein